MGLKLILLLLTLGWILVYLASIIVFFFIVPLPNLFEGRLGIIVTAIIKALLATVLVSGFILLLRWLSYLFFYYMLRRRKGYD